MEKKVMVDNLFEEMKTKLSDYKDCIDGCKYDFNMCILKCDSRIYPECPSNCREALENCIRSCSNEITSKDEEILTEYLDKIEAIFKNEN